MKGSEYIQLFIETNNHRSFQAAKRKNNPLTVFRELSIGGALICRIAHHFNAKKHKSERYL